MDRNLWGMVEQLETAGMSTAEALQTLVRDYGCEKCTDCQFCGNCLVRFQMAHKLVQGPVSLNENSSLAKSHRKAHQTSRPKRTLSFIPSLKPENYERLTQTMQDEERLNLVLNILSPGHLLEFTRRKSMLDFFPILFTLIAMVYDHNQRNPHNHFTIIDMSFNKNLKKNLDDHLYFKMDDCKKYLCFVETGQHFTVIYFDVSSKIVMYADSMHSFAFEKEKIIKIAKMVNMSQYDIVNLSKSRIEAQQRQNSCGIHTIANSYMFLKYGTDIPLFHVKAYKIRDQVGTFLWNFFEKYRKIKLAEEDIFGSNRKRCNYRMDFAPESSDEYDSEEEIDPELEDRETFEGRIMKLLYPAAENNFTDSEAASMVLSRASSSSISSISKIAYRRKQKISPNKIEPEVIEISDDELPVQQARNRRLKEKGNQTIEVVTLSDDESSSSVGSEILDAFADDIQSVNLGVGLKSNALTELNNINDHANGLNTATSPHFVSNPSFEIITASESLTAKDIQTSNNDQASDETFVTESLSNMVLEQNTIDPHDDVVSRQNQIMEDSRNDDNNGPKKNSVAPTAILPKLHRYEDVLDFIDNQINCEANETDVSEAVDQVDHVLELETSEQLLHQASDLDQESVNKIPVNNQDIINIKNTSKNVKKNASSASFPDSQTDIPPPNIKEQVHCDTDRLADSNKKNDRNSSRNTQKANVLEQKDYSREQQSPSVICPPQTRTTDTVRKPIHRPERNSSKKPTKPLPNAQLYKINPQAPMRRSERNKQVLKRPHNDGLLSSSDLPASSPKKTKTTWGLYTKGDSNKGRLTRQKISATRKGRSVRNRLDQHADLCTIKTPSKQKVSGKILKRAVLAAVKSREIMWKNSKGYKHYEVWEEIKREVLATTEQDKTVEALRDILENAKRVLRRKISELVLKDVKSEEMEQHLKGYEECKFLRESFYEQKRESRLRREKKLKDQRKHEPKLENNKKKPNKK